ncbi:hypothetical protein EYF80_026426 [Liparis tanakae]|uniref:Uncharacterized protein n=1 Tax=Liparis tanakae TaxID=230148 RepID=A0A4Z2HEK1_9TELE|nr:hypothetical protein EYF80_026426 [Liparis tanakae]
MISDLVPRRATCHRPPNLATHTRRVQFVDVYLQGPRRTLSAPGYAAATPAWFLFHYADAQRPCLSSLRLPPSKTYRHPKRPAKRAEASLLPSLCLLLLSNCPVFQICPPSSPHPQKLHFLDDWWSRAGVEKEKWKVAQEGSG